MITADRGYDLVRVENAADQSAYHRIPRTVLFEVRGRSDYIPDGPEEIKEQNLSLIFKLDGEPIGAVRLDQGPGGRAIVRLVAIANDVQRRGHGAALLRHVEHWALSVGAREILVHSALDAVGFHRKPGFKSFNFEAGDFNSVELPKMIK